MAKNTIFDPTKDGVKADNSGYSSNQIEKMVVSSAAGLIDDETASDDTVYSSAKIYSLLPEDTATGAEVTITDACPDLPIVELTAEINAVQEGTGDPSPDNVRPISGWDEITVTHDDIDVEISLGDNTVYGGSLNVTTGELTITNGKVDLSDLTWVYQTTYSRFNCADMQGLIKSPPNNNTIIKGAICSLFNVESSNNTGSSEYDNIIGVSSTGNIQIRDTSLNGNLDSLDTLLQNSALVYPLATPTTIILTPHQINTNGEGSTIISCDSGDVTVTYKKLTSFLLS